MIKEGQSLLLDLLRQVLKSRFTNQHKKTAMRCGFFTRQIQRLEMSEPKAGRKFKKANEQSRNRLDGPVQCDVVTESVLLVSPKNGPNTIQ